MSPLYGRTLVIGCALLGCTASSRTDTGGGGVTRTVSVANCSQGQAGLTLPDGFCATVFADKLGAVRHMVVAPNGDLFVNMQRARRTSPLASIPPSQVALRDTNGDGIADETRRFGSAGGTGIALFDGFLYADVGTAIVRYRVTPGQLQTWGAPDTVVTGLPGEPGHTARNFVINPSGTMFVNIGSATNACQEKDRTAGSRGVEGCPELRTRAGVWKFAANGSKQTPSLQNRYATGMRNTVAMAIEPASGRLYATPHGRDQLAGNWPALFTDAQNAEIPAEEMLVVAEGDDFGWPFCYYDTKMATRILAPEYGGDGKTVGRCGTFKRPLYGFPAHWAPNAMMFYEGTQFPARYRQGVFVAFHGSWNRAPLPQQGFRVVFLPFSNGVPAADFETFADGFAGSPIPATGAPHRPTGLAQGPDGALFISDDAGGRIWRVTYRGSQ